MQTKKIAVVASGWHFPSQFYEGMKRQKVPKGWEIDFFCISHRDPKHAIKEKADDKFDDSQRGKLDAKLYERIVDKKYIEMLGWNYKEYPNTIGDWGNSNQWLDENDYSDYDLLLFTHDDNFIIHNRVFADAIEDANFKKWDIMANSCGMPFGHLRGSFEFFKPSVLKKLGGKFDLSEVTLTREGETTAHNTREELNDWNSTVYPMMKFIEEQKLRVAFLSPCYRVSAYCIEGERGYISKTHGANTEREEEGLKYLHDNKII